MTTENKYTFVTLRECPHLIDAAAKWFHKKWGVPIETYLDCMNAYISKKTEYGWYLYELRQKTHLSSVDGLNAKIVSLGFQYIF